MKICALTIRQQEERHQILRKLRAGMSGAPLHDSTVDVNVRDWRGVPNGNNIHAKRMDPPSGAFFGVAEMQRR